MDTMIDNIIQEVTKLRISAVKEKRHDWEQQLYSIEMLLFKLYDKAGTPGSVNGIKQDYFRNCRKKHGYSLRDLAKLTGLSPATLSRIERGKEANFSTVSRLWNFYEKM